MKSSLDFFLLGLLGAFAVGPALFNVYFTTIERRRFPWPEFLGLATGEGLWFIVALILARALEFQPAWLSRGVEWIAGLALLYFAFEIARNFHRPSAFTHRPGFRANLKLLLLNPNILLFDLMLLVQVRAHALLEQSLRISAYWVGVFTGVPLLIFLILRNHHLFIRLRKPLEGTAAVFFLFIGLKLITHA